MFKNLFRNCNLFCTNIPIVTQSYEFYTVKNISCNRSSHLKFVIFVIFNPALEDRRCLFKLVVLKRGVFCSVIISYPYGFQTFYCSRSVITPYSVTLDAQEVAVVRCKCKTVVTTVSSVHLGDVQPVQSCLANSNDGSTTLQNRCIVSHMAK